ncbi:MAG: glycerophosphodiester phosphodiesterase family protein [Pseudomonadota bacterium]
MIPALATLIKKPIAHRGLHDGNKTVFENTRSAFQAAIDGGYGIELDVQISSDGHAIVFHDDTLDRLTARTGPVRLQSSQTLGQTEVGVGPDTAETLERIFALIDGKVPIVVELKDNGERNADLAKNVATCLANYAGPVAVMSFSHNLIGALRQQKVTCPIGLTAEGIGVLSLDQHRIALDMGVDFVSYHVHGLPNAFVRDVRAMGKPVITWTVRNREDAEHSYAHADQITFEGFRP